MQKVKFEKNFPNVSVIQRKKNEILISAELQNLFLQFVKDNYTQTKSEEENNQFLNQIS